MMMPANYSAIAENEMTYVNGGADIWAPAMGKAQWQQFVANQVTIIGNSFMGGFIQNTLGTIFSGKYLVDGNSVIGNWYEAQKSKFSYPVAPQGETGDAIKAGLANAGYAAKGVLNVGLNILGNAAAIYNLATTDTKISLPTKF